MGGSWKGIATGVCCLLADAFLPDEPPLPTERLTSTVENQIMFPPYVSISSSVRDMIGLRSKGVVASR